MGSVGWEADEVEAEEELLFESSAAVPAACWNAASALAPADAEPNGVGCAGGGGDNDDNVVTAAGALAEEGSDDDVSGVDDAADEAALFLSNRACFRFSEAVASLPDGSVDAVPPEFGSPLCESSVAASAAQANMELAFRHHAT
jgi:hypothetical protein